MKRKISLSFVLFFFTVLLAFAQQNGGHKGHDHSGHNHSGHNHSGHNHSGHDHSGHDHSGHDHSGHNHGNKGKGASHDGHGHKAGAGHANACGYVHDNSVFNPGKVAFHHISDQNIYSIGPWHFPLPCIPYSTDKGLDFFSSSKFAADTHGTSTKAYKRYVLYEGAMRRIKDSSFPQEQVDIGQHNVFTTSRKDAKGKERAVVNVCYNGKSYECDNKSTADFGLFGGGFTSFYDFSITKNVFTMILIAFLLGLLFISIAKKYKKNPKAAPSGAQGFMETMFVFIQDEVCKPFLGPKWEKYTPFLMALFFFILGLNLFGQVPFFGGSNVTGNLAVTAVLAIFAFFVVNFSGNGDYWKHIFWMPGIPAWVKTVVTPVEFAGVFIKPITLMLRLFGNITAGHMVIVIFVGLIFIFGENGANPTAAWGTSIASMALTLFMMAIELLVAFIQAFVFTILTASYIGASTEEHHAH